MACGSEMGGGGGEREGVALLVERGEELSGSKCVCAVGGLGGGVSVRGAAHVVIKEGKKCNES